MNHQDLINACKCDWQQYIQHDFVHQLSSGNLNHHAYIHYLKQDFLFLKQYARAYALAIYKARTLAHMRMALPSVQALLATEISHHVEYCEKWGLTEQDMEAEQESFGTVAYTRYVLDAGMTGDLIDLYVALAPCSLGYAEIGRNLNSQSSCLDDKNPYQSWIDLYSGEEFQAGAKLAAEQLDQLLSEIDRNSQRGQQLCQVFATATRMEVAFWQQGLDAEK
ncbi:thiaminase II [Vibrio sp. 99-8-1]|uniref:thiaminase II n=1 Tax=Vibrio sp. 99-8-1 TaxID=2607602 RepID=UPI0014934D2F|nr:thiaminase II [Vibrio sp. 99-8-1]NOI64922.1 thiaminase II [Vibrio sp. 99-8-1]